MAKVRTVIDVVVPQEQEGTQAVVRAWLKSVGDRVEENDPLVELETDKVAVEVPAPAAGVLREILLDSNAEAVPGAILGRIAPVAQIVGNEDEASVLPEPSSGPARSSDESSSRPLRANQFSEMRLSPSVKRACLQHNVDPAEVQGTGRDGRITRADVDRFVQASARPAAQP
ncbi:MAG: E3 binding domain-containing protein, partial [Pseudomonadota bacterium]|nr:E3 binding domain-containing protein [Pseudomonadota bacterium]